MYKLFLSQIEKEKEINVSLRNNETKLEDDKKKMGLQIDDLNTKIKGLENTIEHKNKFISQLVIYF